MQTVPLNPASCSKLFHCSCEMQGSSRRTSSSKSHQPFSSPKINVMNSQGRVSSTIDHRAAGAEQLLDVIERLAQVLRGMQDVGRDDQVERMRIESLLDRVTLDIERPELHERILSELVLGVGREARGDIGEHVFGAMFRQDGKDKAGRSAGSAANLQNSQRSSFRQTLNDLDDRLLHQQIVEAKGR